MGHISREYVYGLAACANVPANSLPQYFQPNYSQRVMSGNNNPIELTFTHSRVDICAPYGDLYGLMSSSIKNNIFLTFVLEKDLVSGVSHPDLNPSKFFNESINYFANMGFLITTIIGEWEKESVNYREFMQNLESNMSREQAALETWTGRKAKKNGFSRVEEYSSEERDVDALLFQFKK